MARSRWAQERCSSCPRAGSTSPARVQSVTRSSSSRAASRTRAMRAGRAPLLPTFGSSPSDLGVALELKMLHHISLGTADLERSVNFYDAVLGTLGYARVWTDRTAVGYGYPGGGDKLAIKLAEK